MTASETDAPPTRVGVAGAALATMLVALGLDTGWGTHALLTALGIPDTLPVRVSLLGCGLLMGVLLAAYTAARRRMQE